MNERINGLVQSGYSKTKSKAVGSREREKMWNQRNSGHEWSHRTEPGQSPRKAKCSRAGIQENSIRDIVVK